jgi:sulfonate transport system permease protein
MVQRILTAVVIIVGGWWIVSFVFFNKSQLIPRPFSVFRQIAHDGWGFYAPNISATLGSAFKGYLWGNGLAILVACVILVVPALESSLLRLAIASYCLPLIAVGPILVTVMDGDGPRVVLAALSVFFTTLIGTLLGLRQADQLSLDLVHSCGGSRFQALRKVRTRAALPSIFAALQIAAPAALLGAMLGEYLGATSGLGVALLAAQRSLQVDRAWGIAIVTSLLASIGFAITVLARHVVVRWNGEAVTVATGARQAQAGRGHGPVRTVVGLVVATVLSTASLILVWQLVVSYTGLDPFVAKGPADVWRFLFEIPDAAANRSELFGALSTTLSHAALGYIAGTALAFLLACVFALSPFAERTVMPVAIALQSVPIVAMVPIIAIVFGRGAAAVTIVCAAVTFFPTLVNLGVAMRATPRPVVDVFRAYSATPPTVLWRARVPSALPALFASARIAAPGALFGALLAEWLVTGNGLGYLMLSSGTLSRYAAVWAATVVITIVSILFYTLVAAVERQALARFSLAGGR